MADEIRREANSIADQIESGHLFIDTYGREAEVYEKFPFGDSRCFAPTGRFIFTVKWWKRPDE